VVGGGVFGWLLVGFILWCVGCLGGYVLGCGGLFEGV